jgi:hypothetical protein
VPSSGTCCGRGRNDKDVVVRATQRHVPDETYVVDFVDEGSKLGDRVSVRFEEKYDRRETAFVFLDRESPPDDQSSK